MNQEKRLSNCIMITLNIITEFVAFRPKTYSYLTDMILFIKNWRDKKCVIKQILKFNDYKKCLFDKKPILQL